MFLEHKEILNPFLFSSLFINLSAQSMLLPVQRQLLCAQVQLADLLMVVITEAGEEEQAERDRWQELSSVEKVCTACCCGQYTPAVATWNGSCVSQYIDEYVQKSAVPSLLQLQWKEAARYNFYCNL